MTAKVATMHLLRKTVCGMDSLEKYINMPMKLDVAAGYNTVPAAILTIDMWSSPPDRDAVAMQVLQAPMLIC